MENMYSTIASASKNSPKLVGVGVMGFLLLIGGGLCYAIANGSKQGREISCGMLHVSGAEKKENEIAENKQEQLNNTETK